MLLKGEQDDYKQRIYFRDLFREARSKALNNAENFEDLIFALEKLGKFLHGESKQIGDLVADYSCLSKKIPECLPEFHTDFCTLYDLVRKARNSAMHEGVFARNITRHAIELSIVLEDALMSQEKRVKDFMIRNALCAFGWQPLSFIRQNMLANSFSYLPFCDNGKWKLISDLNLTKYLQDAENRKIREQRLSQKLKDSQIKLIDADTKNAEQEIKSFVNEWKGLPICVTLKNSNEIVGILTPFDLL
jgi:hypothetical protein